MAAVSSCPSASICAADPTVCQSRLSGSEFALLVTLVTVPLFSMLWLPLAGSVGSRYRQGLHPGAASGLGVALGFSSGMLAVMASLAFAFIPTFFLLLSSPHPCATAIGACGSISCACGNFYPSGYAWMNAILTISTLLIVRETSDLPWRTRAVSATGGLAILFTAINPERFSLDTTSPADVLAIGYMLHIFGLAAAIGLLVFVPFARVVRATRLRGLTGRSRCRVLLPRTAHIATLVAYLLAFAALRPQGPDVSDFCSPNSPAMHRGSRAAAAAACNAWPSLPPAKCARLRHLPPDRGQPLPVRYTCAWVNASLSEAEELLMPSSYDASFDGACTKATCRLLVNARSMALEFGFLFLQGAYVTLCKRVRNRSLSRALSLSRSLPQSRSLALTRDSSRLSRARHANRPHMGSGRIQPAAAGRGDRLRRVRAAGCSAARMT